MPGIRNAFVLGAGLGTRLRSITARRPKPLIPICGKPLITFAFDHLLENGVTNLVVNTHHCPEAYARHFPARTYRGVPIHFEHEEVLLETGGGIKNIEHLLRGGPFIVYNADVLTDLPIERAIAHHFERGNEVTMVLRSRGGPLHVALDESSGRVTDIRRMLGTQPRAEFLFAGIYVVNPEFLARIPPETKISVIPIFLEMIRQSAQLGGIVIDDGCWWDLGTREQYLDVHRVLRAASQIAEGEHPKQCHSERSEESPTSFRYQRAARRKSEILRSADSAQNDTPFGNTPPRSTPPGNTPPAPGHSSPWPVWIDPTASVSPAAIILGATVIGARAKIGGGAVLTDCIVWEDAEIAVGSTLEACIVTAAQRVSGTHRGADF
jgi:mannose-1-phosphate guanylyltransferase